MEKSELQAQLIAAMEVIFTGLAEGEVDVTAVGCITDTDATSATCTLQLAAYEQELSTREGRDPLLFRWNPGEHRWMEFEALLPLLERASEAGLSATEIVDALVVSLHELRSDGTLERIVPGAVTAFSCEGFASETQELRWAEAMNTTEGVEGFKEFTRLAPVTDH